MVAPRQQRFTGGAEIGVAVDRCAAEMAAVIALFQTEELDPPRLAPDPVVLPRQPQRGFHTVRPAAGKEGPGAAAVWVAGGNRGRGRDRIASTSASGRKASTA